MKFDAKYYTLDYAYLGKFCVDQIIRRCVHNYESQEILHYCHDTLVGGDSGPQRKTRRVLHSGLFWPTISNMHKILLSNVGNARKQMVP